MSEFEKVLIQLFVRASITDREEKGPCPMSQKWFMAYYVLVERQYINLEVIPVTADRPPDSFTRLDVSRHLPVAFVVSGLNPHTNEDMTDLLCETDDALENLMAQFKCPNLTLTSVAFKVTEDIYRNFNAFLIMDNPRLMLTDLQKLDDYLGRCQTRYLEGDDVCYADCLLMPKLQHLRVASAEYKGFEIPHEYRSVWRYLANMYETHAFITSCPSDRDIIIHYQDKVSSKSTRQNSMLIDDRKTMTVPSF